VITTAVFLFLEVSDSSSTDSSDDDTAQLKRQNLGDRTPEFQSAPSIRSPQEIINSRGLRRHQFRQFETPPPPGRRAAEQAPRSELDSQDIDRTLLQDDNPFFEREDSIPRDSEEPELEEPSEISDIMTVRKEDRKKGSKNKVHEQVEEYQRHTRSKTKQEENESLPPLPDQNDDFEEFYDVQFAFRAALKAATASPDQQTVTEALNGENADEWRAAIKKEFKNHDQNGIWEVVRRSEAIVNNQRVLGGRTIMKSKYNKLNEIENRKGRYVVQGFRQEYGKDYTDTSAGVCKNTSVKTLLALAALFDWEIEHWMRSQLFSTAVSRPRCISNCHPVTLEKTANHLERKGWHACSKLSTA